MSANRSRLAAALTALPVLGGLLLQAAPPAGAASMPSLPMATETLAISLPASANLGSAALSPAGSTLSGLLGTTTVTDTRSLSTGWTVSISATSLSDGATPTPDTIAASKLKAYIALGNGPTVISGMAVPVTTHSTSLTGLQLSTTQQVLLSATATGQNTVSYNPTIGLTIDPSDVAGTYTGTITQTVS